MTDDELLATVLRRFIRGDGDLAFSMGEPWTMRLDGSVSLTLDEYAAIHRECRAWVKAQALANGNGSSTTRVHPCGTMDER